jgi:hypothetical protein
MLLGVRVVAGFDPRASGDDAHLAALHLWCGRVRKVGVKKGQDVMRQMRRDGNQSQIRVFLI